MAAYHMLGVCPGMVYLGLGRVGWGGWRLEVRRSGIAVRNVRNVWSR